MSSDDIGRELEPELHREADRIDGNSAAWAEIGAFVKNNERVGPDPYDAADERNYLYEELPEPDLYEGYDEPSESPDMGEAQCQSCGAVLEYEHGDYCADCDDGFYDD